MMSIEIKNKNAFFGILLLPVPGGKHTVIEKAEAKRKRVLRMMAGRTNQTKHSAHLFSFKKIHGSYSGTGCKHGNFIGIVADLIITVVNKGLAGKHRFFKAKEPVFIMGKEEMFSGSRLR